MRKSHSTSLTSTEEEPTPDQEKTLSFRPHHFLCTLCFQGKGYSRDFINNYTNIATLLNTELGDDIQIQIVPHTDSICSPCPHRVLKNCTHEEKISHLDEAHTEALALKNVSKISWGDAKKRIYENMTLEKFHQICAPCNWKKYQFCENVLTEFLKKPS